MRMLSFSNRTAKEILRDPLNLCFGLGFPLVILVLLSAIQANVPVPMFEIAHLTPGVSVFGLAFMALFSALLLAKDRESALLQRLYTTPLRASDYILGYILPLIPMAISQSLVTYAAALFFGLELNINILLAVLLNIPIALFYVTLGLCCGSVMNSKQVGGVCGALLTNLSAWVSGIWFDVALVGGVFETVAELLPFIHAVELARAAYSGNFADIFPHLWWVIGYTAVSAAGAIMLFLRQMRRQ